MSATLNTLSPGLRISTTLSAGVSVLSVLTPELNALTSGLNGNFQHNLSATLKAVSPNLRALSPPLSTVSPTHASLSPGVKSLFFCFFVTPNNIDILRLMHVGAC